MTWSRLIVTGDISMSFSWIFKQAKPGDRARESQVEKFFSSDAVEDIANAIVREGIQNSLDAAPEDVTVKVRIKIGSWPADISRAQLLLFEKGFREHYTAKGVASKLKKPPVDGERFRFLTFEDFGTHGLRGDPAAWWPDENGESEPFFNYFRAEGISGKTDGARGRHGVGRLVFMFASRTRSMFGLTRRTAENGGSEELLMGTTVLKNHRIDDTPYLPDGWFGIADNKVDGLTLPIQDAEFINKFKKAFCLSRSGENGLSVSVPWLHDDVTTAAILRSVITGYYHPILSGKLKVEVVDDDDYAKSIESESIESIIENGDTSLRHISPMIALAKRSLENPNLLQLKEHPAGEVPKWGNAVADEETLDQIHELLESGEVASIRVPIYIKQKEKSPEISFFDIHMTRDPNASESKIDFIREGIIISDVRPRRTSGIRALVVVEEGPLATFLGDSENPSHTQWQKDMVKDKYVYAPGRIEFVTQSVPQIVALIGQKHRKPDTSLLIDLFSIPANSGHPKPKVESKQDTGNTTGGDNPDIKKKRKRYTIEKRKNGFAIKGSEAADFKPFSFVAKSAYAVRRGNAFSKYDEADFSFKSEDIQIAYSNCELKSIGANWVIAHAKQPDFELCVTGFDSSHRDVIVEVKEIVAASNEEADDAA